MWIVSNVPDTAYSFRSFRKEDAPACRQLYREGLLGGQLADNDSGLDIDDIDSAYMRDPGNHFWVAETAAQSDGGAAQVVGMIGVQHYDDGVGEIRRLRVRIDHRRKGIGSKLIEMALRFCQEHNYLKITLDTFMEREPAIKLFEKFHFKHSRTKMIGGKELLYFYLDLYSRDQRPRQG
jgi:ribosomal protein S18 acetylase RimI-like enzyme